MWNTMDCDLKLPRKILYSEYNQAKLGQSAGRTLNCHDDLGEFFMQMQQIP